MSIYYRDNKHLNKDTYDTSDAVVNAGSIDSGPDPVAEAQLLALFRPGSRPPTNLTATIIVIAIFWPKFDHGLLIIWLCAVTAVNFFSNHIKGRFCKVGIGRLDFNKWFRLGIFNEFLYGLLWSFAILLLKVPDSIAYDICIFAVSVGVIMAAYARHLLYIPAFYAYAFPMLIAFSLRSISEGDAINLGLAALTLLLAFSLRTFGRRVQYDLVENIRLRCEKMALAEDLAKQKELAEQSNVAKSKFLAAASHDVRQPLAALMLHHSVLQNRNRDSELVYHIKHMGVSLDSLHKLFDTFIDLSRLDAGVVEAHCSDFEIKSLIENLESEYAMLAGEKGLQWRGEIRPAPVYSDPVLLETVVRNLMANAVKYTEKGGISIRVDQARDEAWVDFVIEDTGVGIAESRQREIFDEFRQLEHGNEGSQEGFGLGLAIVKRIAALLRLEVALESEPEKGSTFVLRIPRGNLAKIDKTPRQNLKAMTFSGTRILVIDDDSATRQGLRHLLQDWGCRVVTANSLQDALQQTCNQIEFDVLILDYELGYDQTGIEAAKTLIYKSDQPIPVLILTGNTSERPARETAKHGFLLLHKPVKPAKIRSFLSSVVCNADANH